MGGLTARSAWRRGSIQRPEEAEGGRRGRERKHTRHMLSMHPDPDRVRGSRGADEQRDANREKYTEVGGWTLRQGEGDRQPEAAQQSVTAGRRKTEARAREGTTRDSGERQSRPRSRKGGGSQRPR